MHNKIELTLATFIVWMSDIAQPRTLQTTKKRATNTLATIAVHEVVNGAMCLYVIWPVCSLLLSFS